MTFFWTAVGADMSTQTEDASTPFVPGHCAVCRFEHDMNVPMKSRKKAIKHRIEKHRWLHDWLVQIGRAEPAK